MYPNSLLFVHIFTERLSLNGNALTGTIATELGGLSSLEVLELQMNSLSGTIPSEFGDLYNISKFSYL